MNRLHKPLCLAVALTGIASQTGRCHAQLLFDLLERNTEVRLATLELSSLPATHVNVVSLTFSADWETTFGVEEGLYPGDFDITTFGTVDILADGTLGCVECADDEGNNFIDNDGRGETAQVRLYFASTFPDFIRVEQAASSIDRTVPGYWTPRVPEPSGLLLLGVASLCSIGSARIRNSDSPRPMTRCS